MESLKKELIELFKPEHIKLKNDVLNILTQLRFNKSIIKGIDWEILLREFDENFEDLYKSFGLTKSQSGLFANKLFYRRILINTFKEKIIIILIERDKKKEVLNINELISSHIKEFFKIFRVQHFIEQFDKENLLQVIEKDKEITKKEIEKLKLDAELGAKFKGGKQNPDEINIFKKILEEYKNNKAEGKYISLKSLTNFYGRKDLKYGLDDDHKSELENFYKRFNTYKKKLSHLRR